MSVKVVFSDSYSAKMKRIQRLPSLIPGMISGYTKRDILEIKRIFHDGIKNNTLHLEKLSSMTVAEKARKGYSKPSSPLYGKGDNAEDRSYANMLNVTKAGNKWKLKPSTRMHHSRKLKLSDLFTIHEHGAVIRQQRGDTEVLIRIPPRPALMLSYRRFLYQKRRDKKEQSKEVTKAMTDLINNGNSMKIKNLQKWEDRQK